MEQKIEMVFDRQHNIYNPEQQKSNVVVIGLGCVGSFVISTLAQMGIKSIVGIDFDEVNIENVAVQFYRLSDIGKKKTQASYDNVKERTGTEIKIVDVKIDEEHKLIDNVSIDLNTIIVMCVDTIEARKLIYNEIKELPIKLLDARMGGNGFQIYTIDLESENDKKEYEKLFEVEDTPSPCGEKAIIYTVLNIASEMCNIVKQIDNGERYFKKVMREMSSTKILGG